MDNESSSPYILEPIDVVPERRMGLFRKNMKPKDGDKSLWWNNNVLESGERRVVRRVELIEFLL